MYVTTYQCTGYSRCGLINGVHQNIESQLKLLISDLDAGSSIKTIVTCVFESSNIYVARLYFIACYMDFRRSCLLFGTTMIFLAGMVNKTFYFYSTLDPLGEGSDI